MYSKNDLIGQLEDMGIERSGALMVHSSMRAIGDVCGGADTVVDALMEYMSPGLLLMPCHTWKQMNAEYNVFDPATEPSCTGIVTEIFRKREGVVRSMHPTHSVCAFGKKSTEYIKGDDNACTPCPVTGSFGKLEQEAAKILLIGVGNEKNTFIHSVEESMKVPERFTEFPVKFYVKQEDGSLKERMVYRHFNVNTPHISEMYVKADEALLYNDAMKKTQFGEAKSLLCDSRRLAAIIRKLIEHEENCFIDRDYFPLEWWM